MTVVLGQKFVHGFLLIADSRLSRQSTDGTYQPWRDNGRKIFSFGEVMVAFAGNVYIAGGVFDLLSIMVKNDPRLFKIKFFELNLKRILSYCYEEACKKNPATQGDYRVDFMVAGGDSSRPVRDPNGRPTGINIFESILYQISFPGGVLKKADLISRSVLAMGSGEAAVRKIEKSINEMGNNMNLNIPLNFTAFIVSLKLKEEIIKQNITTVGGMHQIYVFDNLQGLKFVPYRTLRNVNQPSEDGSMEMELIMESNGQLIQKDLGNGRSMPLLSPSELIKIKTKGIELF